MWLNLNFGTRNMFCLWSSESLRPLVFRPTVPWTLESLLCLPPLKRPKRKTKYIEVGPSNHLSFELLLLVNWDCSMVCVFLDRGGWRWSWPTYPSDLFHGVQGRPHHSLFRFIPRSWDLKRLITTSGRYVTVVSDIPHRPEGAGEPLSIFHGEGTLY